MSYLGCLVPEPGALRDRPRLSGFERCMACTNPGVLCDPQQSNTDLRRLYSNPVDKTVGCVAIRSYLRLLHQQSYPEKLRRIKFYDAQRDKRLSFLTNQFILRDNHRDLYRCRGSGNILQVDQAASRIKAFYDLGQCGEDSDLDCALRLCVGGDR